MWGTQLKHVVVTEELHPAGRALLDDRADIVTTYLQGSHDKLPAALAEAQAILVRTMELTASDLRAASRLEIVSRHGVGCDNIDVQHLSSRGIPMAIAVNSNTTSVVEHVLMMMLALNKRAFQYDQFTRHGKFDQRSRHHTSELYGKHVLIVGFGRIGKRVAPVCKALGMRVTVADIALDHAHAAEIGVETVSDFKTRLDKSDYVTVHVPLDESTHHLISQAEIEAMPAHAILINCARGGIIDEHAVAEALETGALAAFGCDVFSQEPPPADHPLFTVPNTLLTPHNAAGTAESLQRMATYASQNILDHFDGRLAVDSIFNANALSR
ncbi:MAG: hydroxyacid dehydrogenase [Granulosicoccus sp.]